MNTTPQITFSIRKAGPHEYMKIGRLLVDVYSALPGMPSLQEQPDYYQSLLDVEKRGSHPAIEVWIATGPGGEILGSVDFIKNMRHYGSGGPVTSLNGAAGIRLLAVNPECRGQGIGKALTLFCIDRARELENSIVVLHTTRAMGSAWKMYENLGFVRFPEIDFTQGRLEVFGFRRSTLPNPSNSRSAGCQGRRH